MGWKSVKDEYKIEHIVSVSDRGICIGSPYILDIIVVRSNGDVLTKEYASKDPDIQRYLAELRGDRPRLIAAIQKQDEFSRSIPVFSYRDGRISEHFCEEPGFPNCTHEGLIMFVNAFSVKKSEAIEWAIADMEHSIDWSTKKISELDAEISRLTQERYECARRLSTLKEELSVA